MAAWTHLVRFIAKEDGQIHLGEVDAKAVPDVGIALDEGKTVTVQPVNGDVFEGTVDTAAKPLTIGTLLSPLSQDQVPIIRCIGLNYRDHARESSMPIPDTPVVFIKPRTALAGPAPARSNIPKIAQDGTCDYEAELAVVISKTGRDIPVEKANEYVLGYTSSNDVSARTQQFKNTQWSYAKGFDAFAPIGPTLVSHAAITSPQDLDVKAILNGKIVQDTNTREMIFDVPTLISFLSQGTTLERGTVILTGTGPGIGFMRKPRISLNHGDDMRVYIDKIGTLINTIHYE